MPTHPLWQPFQLIDPAEVDNRLLMPRRTGEITVVSPDPGWPAASDRVRTIIVGALGPTALAVEQVGSTAVPGLWAKPIIDVELIVADSAAEDDYLAALEAVGFTLAIREPEWEEHRLLEGSDRAATCTSFPVTRSSRAGHVPSGTGCRAILRTGPRTASTKLPWLSVASPMSRATTMPRPD